MRTSGSFPRLLCALVVFVACSTFAHAQDKPAPDTIVFTNGDQLTGKLERAVGDSVVFKSDIAGEITVSLDKVKELRSSGSFAVLRKGADPTRADVARGALVFTGGNLSVASASGQPETVPEKDVAYIIDQATYEKDLEKKAGFRSGWNGSINGGATLVRSTDTGETFTAGIALVRAIPTVPFLPGRNRTTFDLQETYGKLTTPVIPQPAPPAQPIPASVAITSIFHADAERDEYFSARVYALGQAAFDHNYAQGLNLQQVYGAGIGWSAIKSAKQGLDLKGTMQYEKQTYVKTSNTPDHDIIGSTISELYHRNLPRKLLFTEAFSALPAWNEFHAFSANGSVSLAMPVYKRLSLAVTTSDNFLNDPAFGYKKNSYQFVTTVSYSLK
ncbi:MAG TPA: DUF481 domain-containing protein [Acidobacteriaceae bacterium]|nr:DUF481 domain-containing protein [Acidobacteriaceae bacterium]